MKKLVFALALLLIFLVNSFAQTSSSVVVFNQEGDKFYVIVDGIRQNDIPKTNIKVTNLTAPNYKFRIIFDDKNIPSIDKNVMTKNADDQYTDISYNLKKNDKGVYVMRLSSYDVAKGVTTSSDATQYSAPLTLQENASATTTQTTTVQTTTVNQNVQTDQNGGSVTMTAVDPVTGQAINMNVNVNATGMNTQPQNGSATITTVTTTTTTNQAQPANDMSAQSDHYVMSGYNGPIGCHWPMSDNDFSSAKQSVSSKSFEQDKLTVAKQVLGSNCMTCEQIKGIMKLFSFEDSRLDFAKYAYGYVYDPGNFYKLNDAFTFSSSVDKLNEYINANKKY